MQSNNSTLHYRWTLIVLILFLFAKKKGENSSSHHIKEALKHNKKCIVLS